MFAKVAQDCGNLITIAMSVKISFFHYMEYGDWPALLPEVGNQRGWDNEFAFERLILYLGLELFEEINDDDF
jgi:hypothetical protein